MFESWHSVEGLSSIGARSSVETVNSGQGTCRATGVDTAYRTVCRHCLSARVVDTGDQYAVASDSSRAVTSMSPLATSSSRSASSRSPSYAYPCAAWAAVSTRGHVTSRRTAAMAGNEQIADHRPDINELANPLSAKWPLDASTPLQSQSPEGAASPDSNVHYPP